jgi:hypothetical protein
MSVPGLPRADGFRIIRIAVAVVCVAVIILSVALVFAFKAIQHSREQSVRTSCQESNMRHDQTIAKLDDLIRHAAKTSSPARIRRMKKSRTGTVALIEALTPKRDCGDRVAQLTK